jgi:hypothetical protein
MERKEIEDGGGMEDGVVRTANKAEGGDGG